MRLSFAAVAAALAVASTSAFAPSPPRGGSAAPSWSSSSISHPSSPSLPLRMAESSSEGAAVAAPAAVDDPATDALTIPLTFAEMVRDASRAVSDAYDGKKSGDDEEGGEEGSSSKITRQVIRVLLPRDPANDQLGQYFENDADVDAKQMAQNLVLAPPDETWQGGIMQLYRAAAPTCREILRGFFKDESGLPPKLSEDRSVDESGVDGVGLWSTAEGEGARCFVQPTQETVDIIEEMIGPSGQKGDDGLVMLMNPQWRNVDDALDAASKGGGFWGGVASFLGGKGRSLERLYGEMGFRDVYSLEGYVVKGGNVRMVKRFDTDWAVFAENDEGTDYVRVGTSAKRPTYQDVDGMLDEMGIALKYARDIGLAPKL